MSEVWFTKSTFRSALFNVVFVCFYLLLLFLFFLLYFFSLLFENEWLLPQWELYRQFQGNMTCKYTWGTIRETNGKSLAECQLSTLSKTTWEWNQVSSVCNHGFPATNSHLAPMPPMLFFFCLFVLLFFIYN